MPRTTGEWVELLYPVGDTDVEAVTESSFFSEAEGEVEFHNIQYTGGRVVDGWLNPGQSFRSREWAELVAAAPEAVAAVVRLRRELEEISIGLERKAERAQRNGAYSAAVGYRETAKKITRILNGESNV